MFWGNQGGCDDQFAEKILRGKMNLAEYEEDFAATARAREKAAMAAYHRLTLAPPTRRVPQDAQPARTRVRAPERACFSERCCSKLLERGEFSKKQWVLTLPPPSPSPSLTQSRPAAPHPTTPHPITPHHPPSLPPPYSPLPFHSPPVQLYVASLYWAIMSITSIGYGDIAAQHHDPAEQGVACVLMLLGALAWGQVVGTIVAVISNLE